MKKPEIKDLSLREKIGQTFVFRHYTIRKLPDLLEYVKDNPYGASWICAHNESLYEHTEKYMENPNPKGRKDELHINYLNTLNKALKIPVMPVLDASRGIGDDKFPGHAVFPQAISVGAVNDPEVAYRHGNLLGQDIRTIGGRWLWSPVADNPGIYKDPRQSNCDTESGCKILAAFIKGVQDAGVAAGAKHFPGADPYDFRDSHFCTESYFQSFEYWEQTQGREFKACIDAGVASIMLSHETFKAVDDTMVDGKLLPTPLSHKIVTGLLKEKMGFKGVVLTDDVLMKSVTGFYPAEKLYVEMLKAGCDMILGPDRFDYIDIIEKAVLSGELPESRIDDACERVLNMKERFGIFDEGEILYPKEETRERILTDAKQLSNEVAERGLTLTANRTGFLPVKKESIKKVKVVYIGYSDQCYEQLQFMAEEFERHGAVCDIQRGHFAETNKTLPDYDLIIYATYIGFWAPKGAPFFVGTECEMMMKIMTVCTEKSIGVSFGDPDIFFKYFTNANTFINAYNFNYEIMTNFVKGLYGEINFTDYSPVPLNPINRTNEVY